MRRPHDAHLHDVREQGDALVRVLQRLNVALYSTMALPLIVAICNIATAGGFMTADTSSTLITAGALTVLVMPLVTSLTRTVVDAHPVAAIHVYHGRPAF